MAFVKDMLRMWAHSWKRFISIAMITLLGVAVLTGIYAGCRDAFRSTDRFFDTTSRCCPPRACRMAISPRCAR